MGRKRRRAKQMRVEVIAQTAPTSEIADMIIQALWGSGENAARDFLDWQAKKIKEEDYAEPNQLDHEYQSTATI